MTTPGLGDILYLASCMIKINVTTVQTMPDTPNQYSAQFHIMSDQGDIDLSPVVGPAGPPGQAAFQLRALDDLYDPTYTEPAQLPAMTNTREDIGKYYTINSYDRWGHIVMVTAWIWMGSHYRPVMMGAFGAPGPTPDIQLSVEQIPSTETSNVATGGPTLEPSWVFNLALPPGASGPANYLALFPDVDMTWPVLTSSLLEFTGTYTPAGDPVWQPVIMDQSPVGPYSLPESAFSSYSGVSQQAPIGSFVLPPQPFPWTPVVWGHIGGSGVSLSTNPFMIGCEVLLGDPVSGTQISRGLGNTLGVVNVVPHYSSSGNKSQAITPVNNYAIVPANHTKPAQGTIYVNLWNDGQTGGYLFSPRDAQLFVMVVPVGAKFNELTRVG